MNSTNSIQEIIIENKTKCSNCDAIFTEEAFNSHICEYTPDKKRIKLEIDSDVEEPHPCFQLLKENIRRQEIILKNLSCLPKEVKKEKRTTEKDSTNTNTFHCTICERKFVHNSGLMKHMEKHSLESFSTPQEAKNEKKRPFCIAVKCMPCGRLFKSMQHYDEHVKNRGMLQDLEEVEMIGIDDNEMDWAEEKKGEEEDCVRVIVIQNAFQCEFCDYVFSDLPSLFRHESLHDPEFGYECKTCEISTKTLKDICMHWNTDCIRMIDGQDNDISIDTLFACNSCSETFTSVAKLYEHRHKTVHMFPRASGKNFLGELDLRHLKVSCEICGQVFDTAEGLLNHRNDAHNAPQREPSKKYRQFLCDVCGKTYTQSSHLWQHLRFHRGVRPFKCPKPNCDREFTIRPDLNDHIRKSHTGERPYHCEICGKRFLTGSVFYQHRLIHRGERRYGCEECDKRFYRADALKNHQRIHTGEKPFPCKTKKIKWDW